MPDSTQNEWSEEGMTRTTLNEKSGEWDIKKKSNKNLSLKLNRIFDKLEMPFIMFECTMEPLKFELLTDSKGYIILSNSAT